MLRPWVSPQDLKDYTEIKEIKERADKKLAFDIARAEQKIIKITNNKFDEEEYAEQIPETVKMAIILVAEAYAKNTIEKAKKQIKSESFDDYSYTLDSGIIDLDSLNLEELLSDYIMSEGIGKMMMRLRVL